MTTKEKKADAICPVCKEIALSPYVRLTKDNVEIKVCINCFYDDSIPNRYVDKERHKQAVEEKVNNILNNYSE